MKILVQQSTADTVKDLDYARTYITRITRKGIRVGLL